jgi:quinol-cytochrome oxidoreductase complex cytochrome b subunit
MTWVTGVVAFVGSIGTAFTGYLVQQNFDAEWISTQAKDGLNSVGIGAFFNVLNFGQMLLWHVALFPLVLGVLVVVHILLVRLRGVVPPIPLTAADSARTDSGAVPASDSVSAPAPASGLGSDSAEVTS